MLLPNCNCQISQFVNLSQLIKFSVLSHVSVNKLMNNNTKASSFIFDSNDLNPVVRFPSETDFLAYPPCSIKSEPALIVSASVNQDVIDFVTKILSAALAEIVVNALHSHLFCTCCGKVSYVLLLMMYVLDAAVSSVLFA